MNKCPGKNCFIIGDGIECSHNNCVILGSGIKSTHDYQLIIGNKEVKVSRQLTEEEFQEIRGLLLKIACWQGII